VGKRARGEISEAFDWYLARSPQAASAFETELSSAFRELLESPERYQVVVGQLRRTLLKQFPYAVYFKVYPRRVTVVAVIHGRRRPKNWLARR
jgi:plasmid stabilization system protein ParE